MVGRILKSRYCILEKIASGGEGSIYLARDMVLGTFRAVKELPIEKKREAKFLKQLSHQNIPQMMDYVEQENFCYLVMEYIPGKTLQELIKEDRSFSVEEVVVIGTELTDILKYLHNRKPPVFYCDLKPENLMLTEKGELYLVDFGSAVNGYCELQQECLGTKGYAAPEQYEGRVSAASDLYGLGKTLWILLGKSKWKILFQNPALFRILKKCCRKKEKKRYKNAAEIEEKFLHILQKKRKSKSTIMYVFICAVIAVILGTIVFFPEKVPHSFITELSQATELYYKEGFAEGGREEQKEVCLYVEKRLQRLLRFYKKKDEQRRILLLLGLNSEYAGEKERAELYYKQLLLYEPEYRAGYGAYGMFLWKNKQKDKSKTIWKEYEEKEREGILEGKDMRNETIWEERICE